MYRPNEAKVRNLKTKDYLGKARLVAASDRSNAFIGFAGSEIKNVRISTTVTILPELTSYRLERPKSRTTDLPTTSHLLLPIWSSPAYNLEGNSQNPQQTEMYFRQHPRLRTSALHVALPYAARSHSWLNSTSNRPNPTVGTRRQRRLLTTVNDPHRQDLPQRAKQILEGPFHKDSLLCR